MPVEAAVREAKRYKASFRTAVVDGYGFSSRGHGYWHGWDVNCINETSGVSSNTDVGAAINELGDDCGGAIPPKSKDPGPTGYVSNGASRWGEHVEVALVGGEMGEAVEIRSDGGGRVWPCDDII